MLFKCLQLLSDLQIYWQKLLALLEKTPYLSIAYCSQSWPSAFQLGATRWYTRWGYRLQMVSSEGGKGCTKPATCHTVFSPNKLWLFLRSFCTEKTQKALGFTDSKKSATSAQFLQGGSRLPVLCHQLTQQPPRVLKVHTAQVSPLKRHRCWFRCETLSLCPLIGYADSTSGSDWIASLQCSILD